MYNFSIALQLFSVRTEMEDFEGTLKKVKEMGYDGVEFAGVFGHSAEEIKSICDKIGLDPVSAHVPYAEMEENGEETFKFYSKIGCKFIVLPYITVDCLAGGEKNAEFIENVKKYAEYAHKYGMKLCYHNHDFEFEKVNGEYKLDLLYKSVPAEYLQTQLDTCWVNVGGENPADYIRKYNGRTEIVHLKDFAGKKGENMYVLIGKNEDEKKVAEGNFENRPIGQGLQDIPSILDASKEVGAKWVVVELDTPAPGKTCMECVDESIKYLRSIF